MIKSFSFIIFFIGSIANANKVKPLFRDNSLKTFVTMPFRLENESGVAIPLVNIDIVSSKENCQGMIDPLIAFNFLIKCTKPDSLQVSVYYKDSNDSMIRINYGPIAVTQISDSQDVLQPDPGGSDKYKLGRELFTSHCMSCHQSPYDKPNRSMTQIKNAISGIARMNSIRLTDEQIKAISDYLNHLD